MSDYYVALIYALFAVLGFSSPFVFSLAYEWIDCFRPQDVSTLLGHVPVAMVMGALAVGGYILMDRRSPPRLTAGILLTIMMGIWVTLTSTWAVSPYDAWAKWDWAFKTIVFSAFIPFAIRSRVQIEAFIQVYVFSAALYIVPFAIKGFIGGSDYGRKFSLAGGNTGFNESSTLSAVAIMCIPLLLHLRRHSLIVANDLQRKVLYAGYSFICALGAIATYARTAVIGFAILGVILWMQSRRKFISGLAIVIAGTVLVIAAPESWKERISTIETYNEESSAMSRILVWRWTLDFANSNPLGGGFAAYVVNDIVMENGDHKIGTAFHSIYFETLGEHGWIGLGILLSLILITIRNLRWTMARTRGEPDLAWCNDLARSMLIAFLVLIGCGAFVGIAFQPMLWYCFALTTSVSEYARRSMATNAAPRQAGLRFKNMPAVVSSR